MNSNNKCNICNIPVKGKSINYTLSMNICRIWFDDDYDTDKFSSRELFIICNKCSNKLNISKVDQYDKIHKGSYDDKDIIEIPDYIPEKQYIKYLKFYFKKIMNDRKEKTHV